MARIPIPQRGQPIDATYIYDIVNAVNDLSNQVSSATYKYTNIDIPSGSKQNIKTSEAKIVAGYIEIANNSTVNAGNEKTFSYNFPADFKYEPIATATPVNIGNTPAGKDATIVLTSVTTNRLEGVVRFGSSGNISLAVNLIVVGVPN
jgi:hypothetical protein